MTEVKDVAAEPKSGDGGSEPKEGGAGAAQSPGLASSRTLRIVGFSVVGVIFVGMLAMLGRELQQVNPGDIMRQVRETSPSDLVLALILTALSYLSLTTYDFLGLHYAGKPLPYRKTAFASFISYVFSNNIGLSLFTGLAFRYRIYSAWDLSAVDVAKVSVFCGVTFWLGLLVLGGTVFTLWPPPALALLPVAPWVYRLVGVAFLLAAAAYVALCARQGIKLKIRRWEFKLPPLKLALLQTMVSGLDWAFASTALYLLMPQSLSGNWFEFMSVYMLATVAGLLAHVPAGLGVIETIMLMAFSRSAPAESILASLLVYRAVYYLAPLSVAVVWMGGYELAKATGVMRTAGLAAKRWFESLIPRVFAVLVFAAGVVLLLSGALPAIEARRRGVEAILPLAFVEASHLLGSLTGTGLLIVARGLQKRLDGAYILTCGLLVAGIVFSLSKGFDYEEALILSFALLLLAPCRSSFYRKASLLEARFSPSWIFAIGLALLCVLWIGAFANKHVEYDSQMWWTFTFSGDAPRTLRASLGAVVGALVALLFFSLRPARSPNVQSPTPLEILPLVRACDRTYGYLALIGDKTLLFNEAKTAFIMYAREGRSWIAMGDPVGAESEHQELIWRFRDLVDRYGGWAVFYQVDVDSLSQYVDAGFQLLKLGEEAIIDLKAFALDGRSFKHMRNGNNRLNKDGWVFSVEPTGASVQHLATLERISNEWLSSKSIREKRFSLGFFNADYLAACPLALVRRGDQIVAFANLWVNDQRSELSVDLMRYGAEAPDGVMDFLLTQLLAWGRTEGYQSFNLGMAPFSGMESRPLAPLWSRLGAKLFEHGERFYNFQGLRDYKEKFSPEWRPKYLASPAGRAVPVVLANCATLIAGGIKGAINP